MQTAADNIQGIVILITAIFLASAVFMLLFIVLFIQRRKKHAKEKDMMQRDFDQQLLQSQMETREATFEALGKELHDNVCQLLNSARLLIGVNQRTSLKDNETLTLAGDTIGTAIHEIRNLARTLNKEWLQQFNLFENLAMEAKRINTTGQVTVELQHTAIIPFETEKQLLLFRIIQEAVQNAVKHANARKICIAITEDEHDLTILITDDGIGMSPGTTVKGMGSMNMQQRVNLLEGNIRWLNNKESGTTVEIRLPIKPIQHD